MSPTISVVICCYTEARWEQIGAAVASVQAQTYAAHEIVVVVDHNPALLTRVRAELSGVVAIPNGGHQGLSGARDSGIARATGEIIAFLDDDAAAQRDWLATLVQGYNRPEVVAVGGSVFPRWEQRRPEWFPQEFDWVVGCSYRGLPARPSRVRNLIGANMSFRAETLARVGGFAQDLGRSGDNGAGCEETELCIRAQTQLPDAVIRYLPAARVDHFVPSDRATWGYFRARCRAEGRSKAAVARRTGARLALSTEQSYVRHTLLGGMVRALADSVSRRRPHGLPLAAAILVGLFTTATAYARASLRERIGASRILGLLGPALPLLVALGLWASALPHLDLRAIGQLGLVSVLPIRFWVALALVAVSFCWQVARPRPNQLLLAGHVLAFIAIMHATPAITYGSLRYSYAWKHVGIVDFILRHHGVNTRVEYLGAYDGWPGFFSLNAVLVQLSGVRTALYYASWGPPFFEALYLPALLGLFRTFTRDHRLIWFAIWIFYLGNWVGQDYFSPQATAYFLYLVVIVATLRWFSGRPRQPDGGSWSRLRRPAALLAPLGRFERVAWAQPMAGPARTVGYCLIVLIMLAIASTHQLTPLMLIGALVMLVVSGVGRSRSLPVVMTLITVAWAATMGRYFLETNASWILPSIGSLFGNASATLISLSTASQGQVIVAYADRALTAGVIVLAALGAIRSLRAGYLDLPVLALALAPLALLPANSYGGEMLFRVFLFALPFTAFWAATLFYPDHRGGGPRTRLLSLLVSLLMLTGFALAYYGKERMNYFTPQEVAASSYVYDAIPAGSVLVSATSDYPWAFRNYELYHYRWLLQSGLPERRAMAAHPIAEITKIMHDRAGRPAFLILTRSQQAQVDMTGLLPRGEFPLIEQRLRASAQFRVVFQNRDATIFTLVQPAAGGAA